MSEPSNKLSKFYQKARNSITRLSVTKIERNKEIANESTRIMRDNMEKMMKRVIDLDILLSNA